MDLLFNDNDVLSFSQKLTQPGEEPLVPVTGRTANRTPLGTMIVRENIYTPGTAAGLAVLDNDDVVILVNHTRIVVVVYSGKDIVSAESIAHNDLLSLKVRRGPMTIKVIYQMKNGAKNSLRINRTVFGQKTHKERMNQVFTILDSYPA